MIIWASLPGNAFSLVGSDNFLNNTVYSYEGLQCRLINLNAKHIITFIKINCMENTMKKFLLFCTFISLSSVSLVGCSQSTTTDLPTQSEEPQTQLQTAVFAGGCFWCIEADFEKLKGVDSVVSGYTGGAAETASYKEVTYTETGHYEAVEVRYHSNIVSYSELVEYFWRHIDPTNPRGQFCDSGSSYLSAIFYANEEEQKIVAESLKNFHQNPKLYFADYMDLN